MEDLRNVQIKTPIHPGSIQLTSENKIRDDYRGVGFVWFFWGRKQEKVLSLLHSSVTILFIDRQKNLLLLLLLLLLIIIILLISISVSRTRVSPCCRASVNIVSITYNQSIGNGARKGPTCSPLSPPLGHRNGQPNATWVWKRSCVKTVFTTEGFPQQLTLLPCKKICLRAFGASDLIPGVYLSRSWFN